MTHPECEHDCTSNCRREGCNCECGEYHDTYEPKDIPGFEGTLEALDGLTIN